MIHPLTSLLIAGLLAFGAQDQTPPTPRALLERGALAEEHERDFAEAQRFYEQAEAAALAAGDAATAKEAAAAKERVLGRQGRGPSASPERAEQIRQHLEQTAVSILFRAGDNLPTEENVEREARALSDLGPAVIQVLAQSLDTLDRQSGTPKAPIVAARALAGLAHADADRALAAAFESPDPVVRKAVVESCNAQRSLDTLLLAAEDPAVSVRSLARRRLLTSEDERAAPLIVELARSGQHDAQVWLSRLAPARALELALDESVEDGARVRLLGQIHPLSPSLAPEVVRLIRGLDDADEDLRAAAWNALNSISPGKVSGTEPGLVEMHDELLRVDRPGDDVRAVRLLAAWNSPHCFESMRAAVDRRADRADGQELVWLAYVANLQLAATPQPPDVARWCRLLFTIDPDAPGWREILPNQQRTFVETVLVDLDRMTTEQPLEDWLAAWANAPEAHRRVLARVIGHRMLRDRADSGPLHPSAEPIVRFMLRSELADLRESGARLVGRAGAPGFAADLALAVYSHGDSFAANAIQVLAALDPRPVADAVIPLVLRACASPRPTKQELETLGLLGRLGQPTALEWWPRVWSAAASDAARESLLVETWLRGVASRPIPGSLLVDLYPEFERHAPDQREAVLEIFGWLLLEAALPVLERELNSPDYSVREAAMQAAEMFRKHREAVEEFEAWRKAVTVEESTVAELSQLLDSPNRDVVLGAVRALAILRARPALPALVRLLERDDAELRAAVQAALDEIAK